MLNSVSKLAKLLASDELKTRKLGYKYVRELLSLSPGLDQFGMSYKDVLGVCKGLYYSLWMQDKLLLQEESVTRIVNLLSTAKFIEVRCMYVKAMFETLAREWDNLDIWRQDKFMMLARDFFVSCIRSVEDNKIPIETLSGAIFEHVLNANTNSGIDLKIHLCHVIQQELPKSGCVPTIAHPFLQCSVKTLLATQRGNAYVPKLIKLLFFLAKRLKECSILPLNDISEELLVSCVNGTVHRKTLRNIASLLYTNQSKVYENQESPPECQITPIDAESALIVAPTRKRKLDNNSSLESSIEETSPNVCLRSRKRRRKNKGPDDSSVFPNQKLNCFQTPVIDEYAVEDFSVTAPRAMNGKSVPMALEQNVNHSTRDWISPPPQKKRVSFGKVFRKKFSANRQLVLKPTVQTKPDRGILRR